MAAPLSSPPWESSNLADASKKDIVAYIHENATPAFLRLHKLNGKPASIVKAAKKDALDAAYVALIAGGDDVCRKEGEQLAMDAIALEKEADDAAKKAAADAAALESAEKPAVEAVVEVPKFAKQVLKKGNGERPKKGDTVSCFYTGYLPDGKIFDSNNDPKKKKPVPLTFKVGVGRVIRGWDEGLLTMSKGEKARLVIESEWAYGKKGAPPRIPPDTQLTFEVELVRIE
ncbi:peptidyl-prolyl cis-trans isomerase FKBP3 [Cladochytrium replicatum]|nr:peptidyl-prolyl cis-trans isomerase FKBP3 [Cladochytrium replicatum]